MIVSYGQQRDSIVHRHVSIFPQTPLQFRLPHNIEQSSLCSTAGSCWLFILNTSVSDLLNIWLTDRGLRKYRCFPQSFLLGETFLQDGVECLLVLSDTGGSHSLSVQSHYYKTARTSEYCSPPGSSVHGILQARVLEPGAIAFSVRVRKKFK